MLSHDLGNPVLSIQKAMRLLADEALGPMNADQREVASLALETSRQLYGMVTDFLDIYRYENHRLVLRKTDFDIKQLINDSVSQIQLFARDKNIAIHIEPPPEVGLIQADRNRLMRVGTNILENALQFSPENRNIWIHISRIPREELLRRIPELFQKEASQRPLHAGYLLVSFADEGLGIPERNQKFIFDKFFSSKTRDTSESGRKGLGLGLAFCKLAVESHEGFIWLESPLFPDKVYKRRGCRFTVALPTAGE
jgi:signal transduction histidine kinase